MAFGGRELRLILSIQSYGTTNIQRLRRDIMSLSAATRTANQNQLAVQQQVARQAEKAAASQARISSLQKQALTAQGIGPLRQRLNLEKKLSAMGYRGVVLQDLLAGKSQARSKQAQAMVNTLRAQDMQLARINAELGIEQVKLGEITAEQKLLNSAVLKEAALRDATLAKAQGLQDVELKGRQIAHIGRTAQFAGLIATAGFSLAAGSFAKFSNEAALAATQMRDIGAPMEQAVQRSKELQDAILGLSMQFPATAEDMSKAAYDIFSSMDIVHNGVVDVTKGLNLLEIANKAAVAGGVELQESTNAMITVLNNFDPTLRNVGGTMDTVFSIVRFGQMRLNDFAQAMATLAPITASTGTSLASMGGAFATLTILMKNQQRASAGLGRLYELMRIPAFVKGFKAMGVAVENVRTGRIRPLLDIFRDIVAIRPDIAASQEAAIEFFIQVTKASGLTKAGIQGTVQARRAFEELATHLQLFGSVSKNVVKNKGELDAAFQARMQDPGVQWSIFINQLRAFSLIVGREVLPVFLKIGQRVADFIDWFRKLDPTLRRAIVQFAVWGGIVALLGGTIVNLAGSFIALRANMALMNLAAAEAARTGAVATKQFSAMGFAIRALGFAGLTILLSQIIGVRRALEVMTVAWLVWKTQAIQSIVAVVAAIVTGSATARSAIVGVLVRTGIGVLIVAAGYAVDYIITHWNQLRPFFAGLTAAIAAIWNNMWETIKGGGLIALADIEDTSIKVLNKLFPGLGDAAKKFDEALGINTDSMRKHGQAILDNAGIADAYRKAYIKTQKEIEKEGKKKKDLGIIEQIDALTKKMLSSEARKAWEDWANNIGKNSGDAARLAKANTNAIQEAMRNMNQKVDQAVDNLGQTYDRLRQETEQAFGSFAQGPVMQGILGDIFKNLNDQLRQFGVQIPVPFAIIRRDFDQQMIYFKRWNNDLEKLAKRGAPYTLIEEIRKMGPEAGMAIAEGILNAPKKGFGKLVSDWKRREKDIDKVTKKQLDRQLDYWLSFGKKAAWQFVNGVATSPAWAKLRPTFKKYVTQTFGGILRAEFKAEVAQALKEARQDIVAAATKSSKTEPPPKTTQKAAARQIPIGQLTFGQTQAQMMAINRQQARIHQAITATAAARGLHGPAALRGATTPAQEARLVRLQNRENQLIRHRQAILREERRVIGQQIRWRRREGKPTMQITYHGDTVTVKTGATVNDVMRAFNRRSFRNRNKVHPK